MCNFHSFPAFFQDYILIQIIIATLSFVIVLTGNKFYIYSNIDIGHNIYIGWPVIRGFIFIERSGQII